jgi:hypothetical protein
MLDRMSIPIQRDYNKIWKDFQIQKIKSMSKDDLIVELLNPESWIYELIKDDTISLFLHTSGYTNEKFSTDDLYKLGVDTTIGQIKKRYFFNLKTADNTSIINKIRSRITNNIKNYFSPLRKINYLGIEQYFYQTEDYNQSFERIIDELNLQKIDKETIKTALAKVWKDSMTDTTFDILDFEELCRRFQFESNEVLSYNPYDIPLMAKESCNNGNYQLILVFEIEEVL